MLIYYDDYNQAGGVMAILNELVVVKFEGKIIELKVANYTTKRVFW